MQVQIVLLSVMLWQWGVACEPVQLAPQDVATPIEIVAPDGAVVEYHDGAVWRPVSRRFDVTVPAGREFFYLFRCNGEERRVTFRAGDAVRVEFAPRDFGVDASKIGRERYTLSGAPVSREEVQRLVGQVPDYRNKTRCVVVGDESRRKAFVSAAKSVAPDLIYQDYAADHWVAKSGGYKVNETGFAVYLVDDKGKGYWKQDSDNLDDFRQGVSSVRKPPDPAPVLPGPRNPSPVLPIDLNNLPPWVPVALLIAIFVLLQRGKPNA